MNVRLRNALLTGIAPALAELILLLAVDPGLSGWMLLQAALFWFTCGSVTYLVLASHSPFPALLGGVLCTVFLNLPWYIAESVGVGKPQHFLPLVLASLVQGLLIGRISKWFIHKENTPKKAYAGKSL